jgi:hypothetical protein
MIIKLLFFISGILDLISELQTEKELEEMNSEK